MTRKKTEIKSSPAASLRERAAEAARLLRLRYPEPRAHLAYTTPWELLVATMLAAQCTDERVNSVTPGLFARWPSPLEMARAEPDEVEAYIRPTGFFRMKARNLVASARRIVDVYGGTVPQEMEELTSLPGVARKTANVVLFGAFGRNEGLAVDTHVGRIAFRLGLVSLRDPLRVERELMVLFPREEWGNINHRMVWFGRQVCRARGPLCASCEMALICEKNGVPADRR